MSNIYDFITDFDPSTMARVASAQDANPDQAARAVELAQATGAPAGAIYQNVDEYNDQLKTQMGADIVRRNRALRSYVDSHPLAAAVSNDDWAEMDDASKAAAAVGQEGVFKRFVGGFKEGFGPQFLGSWETGIPEEGSDWLDTLQKRQAYAEAHPIAGAIAPLAALFGAQIEVPGRAVAGAVLGTSRALGLNDSSLQALADPGFWASMGPVGEAVGTFFKGLQANAQMRGEMRAIAPFIGQGELPPVGVHPETDKIHAAQAEADKEALSEALKTSAATATRERSPELYQKLMEQVVQGTIGINSDAVRELYKEKEPAPDDGILGWVPGIRDQLEAPGDISVPLADYLAKVDPAVAKGLEDHVRLRPDGMTIEEVKGIEAYHGTPHEFEAFDTSKIGTGEGAQSFGHGIYLAQSPGTAKFYAEALSGKSDNIVEELANQELMYNNNDREAAAKALIDRAEGEEKEPFSGISADSMRKAADLVTSGWSPKSFLYKARIRRGEEEFLDWDKPLSEQSKTVQNFVRDQGIDETNLGEPAHVSGEKIYQAIKDKLATHKKLPPDENGMYRTDDGREAASRALHDAGIPGIKYLDQGSRDIGEGTRNFVVFNDKDLEIIERNGEKVQGDRTQEAVNTLRQSSGMDSFQAYHGTPHSFDAFDIGKIGTGEGAQAFGRGLYFADHPDVAESYKTSPTGRRFVYVNGENVGDYAPDPVIHQHTPKGYAASILHGYEDFDQAQNEAQRMSRSNRPSAAAFGMEALKELDKIKGANIEVKNSEGHIYQVRIHANKDDFLDYDKPLKEQSPQVRKAIENNPIFKGAAGTNETVDSFRRNLTFGWARNNVPALGPEGAPKALREAGIPGIKYLDQGSRDTGKEGTRNYVVFDHRDVEITHKNGKPVSEEAEPAVTQAEPLPTGFETVIPGERIKINGKGSSSLQLDIFNPKLVKAYLSSVPIEMRGQGNAVDMYKRAVDYTASVGKRFVSDTSVSPEAMRVYEGLKRRGYQVIDYPQTGADVAPRFEVKPPPVGITPSRPFTASPGITKKQTELYYEAMDKRTAEDQAKLEARVVADQRRRQTAEWKVEEAKVRETVSNEIYNDPTVRLFDHLHEGRFTLNADDLSPEQLSALPAKWVRKTGLENAALSDALGVRDITPVLSRLAEIEHNRGTEKPKDFIEGMIDDETDRRMEAAHGDLSRNIISEARDQVLSETQEEMLHEQTRALAEQAGVDYTISKADIKSMVKDHFDTLTASEVSSSKFLAQAGRHGRAMEDAFLKKDVHEAFRQSGAQQVSFMLGREAAKLEKVRTQTERLTGAYSSREVKGRDQQFTNAIHAILQKVGMKIGRSPTDLAREFEETGFSGLAHFISERDNDYAIAGFKIPIADFLLDDGYKTGVDQMPVHEWQGFAQTVKALDYLSRDWDKVNRQGEKEDRAAWISAAMEQLKERFDVRPFDERDKTKFLKKFAKNVIASLHSMPTVFYRFDGRDPAGLFTKMFTYPAAEGANYEAALQRETSKRYRELGAIPKPKQALDHDFIDPMTGEKWVGLTRANLEAIVANIGNKYNLDRIAFTLGKGATDQKGRWVSDIPGLMQWIEENTSKEDIDRAQARGKIFADLKEGSDTVYRNLYGIAPENIELRPFEMHGKEYPGWYHPIIQDEERALQDHAKAPNAETNPTNFWPTTPNGYMQRRTGAFERLSLNDSMVPIKFNQIIHDASMKSFVYEASKIINDRGFRQGITKYYGKEYHDAIKSWLWRIAGSASYDPTSLAGAAYYSNLLRQNVISTYIGFNLGTVLKHGPTAFVASAKEVGPINQLMATARVVPSMMANAVRGLFGQDPALGNSLWQFIWNNSESIQRRDRNWAESTGGVQDILYGKSTLRNRIIQWGSKAVALSDMLSAAPLWLAKYEEVLGETGIHGDAVNQANFAVDRIHGSTSVVHTPNIAAGGGVLAPWFTSLYGYFGANMQRKIEIMHDMNDTYKLARDGEITAAAKTIPGITTSILAQMMWPALIEEWVQSQHTEDHRGYLGRAASFLIQALSNSILGVRDLSWALTHDESNPSAGLITSLYQDIINPIRDFKKPHPLNRQSAGKVVQDSLTAIGDLSGVSPKPVARAVRYGIDVHSGVQHPHSVGDWYRGLTAGQQKKRIER